MSNPLISAESFNQAISNNRILVRIIVIFGVIIVGLAFAIALLFPLKETKTEIYEFSRNNQTFHKISSSDDVLNLQKQLVGLYMRQYVINRESVDSLNDDIKQKWVQFNSDVKVFNTYQDLKIKVLKYLGNGTRSVDIEIDYPFNNDYANQTYVVEFNIIDKKNKKEFKQYFKALINYTVLHEHLTRLDDMHLNPLGIKIIGYSLYPRKI